MYPTLSPSITFTPETFVLLRPKTELPETSVGYYRLVNPTSPPAHHLIQVNYVRNDSDNWMKVMEAGDREFTVSWCLLPVINYDPETGSDLYTEQRERFSTKKAALVFAISALNPKDANDKVFFNKTIGRRLSSDRLLDYLSALSSVGTLSSHVMSDVDLVDISSDLCIRDHSGVLTLPNMGRLFYSALREHVINLSIKHLRHVLDDSNRGKKSGIAAEETESFGTFKTGCLNSCPNCECSAPT